jgi:hypothetical protein
VSVVDTVARRLAMSTTGSAPGQAQHGYLVPREQPRARVQGRRDFGSHLVAYLVINAILVGIWAVTGGGYFWPVWVLGCWGAGLVLHWWDAFVRRPVTEEDVDAEMRRLS